MSPCTRVPLHGNAAACERSCELRHISRIARLYSGSHPGTKICSWWQTLLERSGPSLGLWPHVTRGPVGHLATAQTCDLRAGGQVRRSLPGLLDPWRPGPLQAGYEYEYREGRICRCTRTSTVGTSSATVQSEYEYCTSMNRYFVRYFTIGTCHF